MAKIDSLLTNISSCNCILKSLKVLNSFDDCKDLMKQQLLLNIGNDISFILLFIVLKMTKSRNKSVNFDVLNHKFKKDLFE